MLAARLFIAIAIVLVVCGCSTSPTGFDRGTLRTQVGTSQPEFDSKEIKAAYNKKPNLPKPFRVAIYFKEPWRSPSQTVWRWDSSNKDILNPVLDQLQKQGLVSDYFPLLKSLVPDEDLKSLRLAAARQGADALFVINGATQFDRYVNGWAATYLLLVPALFVPGSEVNTLFVSSAALWDVKNEYLYLASEAETSTHHRYVAAFGERDIELIDDAKQKSLEILRDQIAKLIQGKKF